MSTLCGFYFPAKKFLEILGVAGTQYRFVDPINAVVIGASHGMTAGYIVDGLRETLATHCVPEGAHLLLIPLNGGQYFRNVMPEIVYVFPKITWHTVGNIAVGPLDSDAIAASLLRVHVIEKV